MANLSSRNIKLYLSSWVDSVTGVQFLGGYRTTQELSDNRLHNLFNKTTKDEETSGIVKFRCVYVYNDNDTFYIKNPIVYVVSDTTSSNDSVAVGWGVAKIGPGDVTAVDGSIEQQIFNENTFPANVTFYGGNNRNEGAVLDTDIPPKMGKPLWIMYVSKFGAQDTAYNKFSIRIVTDNLRGTTSTITTQGIPKIKFAVIGECSSTSEFTKIANYIIPRNPDFIVTVGDNNTSNNPQFFLNTMNSYLNRMLLTFGWMDVTDSTVINAYKTAIGAFTFAPDVRNQYYSKTFGNIHILVTDTSGKIAWNVGSNQYSFIENDLKNAYANPNIDWIIVTTNSPAYGSLSNTAANGLSFDVRDLLHPLFVKYGVSFVLQGSFNWYERTQVLGYNITDPTNPTTFAYDGPFEYTIQGRKSFADGCIFMTVGTGGTMHDVFTAIASYVYYFDSVDYGYVWFEVDNTSPTKKTINAKFYATNLNTQFFRDSVQIDRTG